MIFAYGLGIAATFVNVILGFNTFENKGGVKNCIPELLIHLAINFLLWGFIAWITQAGMV